FVGRELQRAAAVSPYRNHPTFRDGEGYPGYSCISVNEEVTHGVPSERRLRDGDIVTLDVGVALRGYVTSRAISVPVGRVRPEIQRFLDVANATLDLAIRQ